VVGYKPTYGTLPRVGVKLLGDSLDTVGLLAGSVADAALVCAALSGRDALRLPERLAAPKLAVCLTPQWAAAQPETIALFDKLPARIAKAGAQCGSLSLPAQFDGLEGAHAPVWEYEMARNLGDEFQRHRERIREPLRGQLERGWSIAPERYDAAAKLARECRAGLADAMGRADVLVVPAARGEAPPGLERTGDPVFNRIWTLLHAPAVTVPIGSGPNGLPLGLQLVGRIGDDARVLAAAAWIEQHLAN
jgi:amidase